MVLPVKHPQARQAERHERKQLFDDGPDDGAADGFDRVIGVHDDVVDLRETDDRGHDGHGTNAEGYRESPFVFAPEVEGGDCKEGNH